MQSLLLGWQADILSAALSQLIASQLCCCHVCQTFYSLADKRFNPVLYVFLLRYFPFFLIKFYLPKPVKRRQTRAPASFNTTESHSWGWVQRLSLESITDLGCCESRAGRRQYHKQRARCWGCEQQARSSAWVNLNGGSTREGFGRPRALCSHLPSSLSLYVQLAAQQRLQTSSNPHNALFCSFSHCAQTQDSHKHEDEEKTLGGKDWEHNKVKRESSSQSH